MNTVHSRRVNLGRWAAVALVIFALAPAQADPLNRQADSPADTATRLTAQSAIEPIPAPHPEATPYVETIISEPIDPCHVYRPDVRYRVKGRCPPCCKSKAPIETTMLVKDPASCDCYAEIDVCLPCCCVGEATICNRDGILGRRWVDYEWKCGFKVSILFRARGDVVVNYIF